MQRGTHLRPGAQGRTPHSRRGCGFRSRDRVSLGNEGVDVFDRLDYLKEKGFPEAEFYGNGAQEAPWASHLEGKVLFTGFHGDKVWDKHCPKVSRDIVRGDSERHVPQRLPPPSWLDSFAGTFPGLHQSSINSTRFEFERDAAVELGQRL